MKRIIIFIFMVVLCCLLFLFSPSAVSAARDGFILWRDFVLPSLLPFFVCVHVMQNLGAPSRLEHAAVILLSFISGAPAGARLCACDGVADTRTAAILNNVSPMFVYGSFCTGMLGCPALAVPIIIAQAFACAIMLLVFPPRFAPSRCSEKKSPLASFADGLKGGMTAMLNICAAIMFFMSVSAALFELMPALDGIVGMLLSGLLEMASGCRALAAFGLKARELAAVAALFFSFGGVSIFAQSLTFCRLDAGKYFAVKLLQGALASLICYAIAPFFAISLPVYQSISRAAFIKNVISFASVSAASLTGVGTIWLISAAARRTKCKKATS